MVYLGYIYTFGNNCLVLHYKRNTMAYTVLSNNLIETYPDAIQALRNRFKVVEEYEGYSKFSRKFEIHGWDCPIEEVPVAIGFIINDGKLTVMEIDIY